jgi:hypothetical protein
MPIDPGCAIGGWIARVAGSIRSLPFIVTRAMKSASAESSADNTRENAGFCGSFRVPLLIKSAGLRGAEPIVGILVAAGLFKRRYRTWPPSRAIFSLTPAPFR